MHTYTARGLQNGASRTPDQTGSQLIGTDMAASSTSEVAAQLHEATACAVYLRSPDVTISAGPKKVGV